MWFIIAIGVITVLVIFKLERLKENKDGDQSK